MNAHDPLSRQHITDSCRVIKSHASFIGTSAGAIRTMPGAYSPICMDELEEAEGVLNRALAKIKEAKRVLEEKEAV